MAESTRPSTQFAGPDGRIVEATFDGGRVTSDGGIPWLVEADQALGLCKALAACVPEWRRGPVIHSLTTLVRQRVFQIACGYADQDDADTLRSDPLLKWACGRSPDRGRDLASQPTLSRLEQAPDRHALEAMAEVLVAIYLSARGRPTPPRTIILDFDGTDDPAHGEQEGVAYHGYYRQYMYHPLLVFDGDTGQLITAVLRPGTVHASRLAVLVLRRLVRRLRQAWPDVAIRLRADSGFAVPRLFAWCDAHGVDYTIGLIPNARLEAAAAPLLAEVLAASAAEDGHKIRRAGEVTYHAGSWPRARRVVFKAEALARGPNTRFVVTARTDADPLEVYDAYVDRGEAENRIKDFKLGLLGDRLSDHRFWANAFRLVLHAAAYWLLDTLRRWLQPLDAARIQLDTLRLKILKIGARVLTHGRRIRLRLSSHHPGEPLWAHLAHSPGLPVNNPG